MFDSFFIHNGHVLGIKIKRFAPVEANPFNINGFYRKKLTIFPVRQICSSICILGVQQFMRLVSERFLQEFFI